MKSFTSKLTTKKLAGRLFLPNARECHTPDEYREFESGFSSDDLKNSSLHRLFLLFCQCRLAIPKPAAGGAARPVSSALKEREK